MPWSQSAVPSTAVTKKTPTPALSCLARAVRAEEEGAAPVSVETASCQSAFGWVASLWGFSGLLVAGCLAVALLRAKIRLAWRRRKWSGWSRRVSEGSLGEVPLAGGMPNEDMFHLDDEDVGEGGGEGGGWESLLVQLKEARASLQLLEVDKSVLEGDKARLRRHMEQVRCPTRPLALWFFLLLLFLH